MNVIAVPVTTLVATMRVPIRVDVMKDIDSKEIQFVLVSTHTHCDSNLKALIIFLLILTMCIKSKLILMF